MKKKLWGFTISICCILIFIWYFLNMEDKRNNEVDDTVTLKWYINYEWFATEWGKDIVSKKISKETGVNIEFVTPKGSEKEKLSSMIHSDTLPDIVTLGWWENGNEEMISQNKVFSYNELEEKYHMGFFKVADKDSVKWYTKDDGNIYGYPSYSYSWSDFQNKDNIIYSNQNFLVRKDIYEAIGSPDMTTPSGFINAIKKAKEMFPTVDGEELIPIGADEFNDRGSNSFDIWLQNFLAVPYEKNGKYYDRNTDEEYLKWLKVFRKLGEEGYLNDEIFIDNRTQLSEKLLEGRYFCLFYQNTDIEEQQKAIYEKNPERIYIAVEGPRNSNGDAPKLTVSGINGWTTTYISKNCTSPEKALELLTFMLSDEGKRLLYLGEEGTMYQIKNGKAIINQKVLEVLNTDRKKYNRIYGADDTYWMLKDEVNQIEVVNAQPSYMKQLYEWTLPYITYIGAYELDFSNNKRMTAISEHLNKLWSDTLIDLLLAKSDKEFEKILDNYKENREKYGYFEFQEAATNMFKINKEKLGIKE